MTVIHDPMVFTSFHFSFSIIRSAFNIHSYRNLEGLGTLFFDKVPDYTRINRRMRQLDLEVLKKINREVTKARTKNRVIEISMDGTGVQINGKYVWIDKKTRKVRKRDWKKINIAIDTETRQILGIKIRLSERAKERNISRRRGIEKL